ncbi:hypothetical protein [Actinacidiphila glaucinigra]|uniref:hypothetical protein n=1 Tax=Actinacidiphila glaucinigra TaxID=235986 RepID=UPI0029A6E9B7|nr:hypothetical protein [Streptomyces sp. PA03-3a]
MTVTASGVRGVSGIVVLVLWVVLGVVLGVVPGVALGVVPGVAPGVVLTAVLRPGAVSAPVVRGVRAVPLERAPCPAP